MFVVMRERLAAFEDDGECIRSLNGIGFRSSSQTAEDYLIELAKTLLFGRRLTPS